MPLGVSPTTVFTKPESELSYIEQRAEQFNLDPFVALSTVPHEGGLVGKVGDNGTSFGPWQLHKGGALPSGIVNPADWANSAAGIDYALGQIAKVTKGKRGTDAIDAMVTQFEKPADIPAEKEAAYTTFYRLSAYQQAPTSIDISEYRKAATGTGKEVSGSASDAGSYDAGDAAHDAGNLAKKVLDPLGIGALISWFGNPENDVRILMAIGGGAAIILGAYVAVR